MYRKPLVHRNPQLPSGTFQFLRMFFKASDGKVLTVCPCLGLFLSHLLSDAVIAPFFWPVFICLPSVLFLPFISLSTLSFHYLPFPLSLSSSLLLFLSPFDPLPLFPGPQSDYPPLAVSVPWPRRTLHRKFREMSEKRLLPHKPDGGHAVIRRTFLGKALNSWNPNHFSLMSLFPLYFPSVPVSIRVLCEPSLWDPLSCIHCQDRIAGPWREGTLVGGSGSPWTGKQRSHDSDLPQAQQTTNKQKGNLPPVCQGAVPFKTKRISSKTTLQRWLWGRNRKKGLEGGERPECSG